MTDKIILLKDQEWYNSEWAYFDSEKELEDYSDIVRHQLMAATANYPYLRALALHYADIMEVEGYING